MTAPTGKRAGRPPQMALAQTSSRSTFTVRMRGDVRAALIEASNKSGRSISEELEARLERSFDLEQEFGGAKSFNLLLHYARILRGIEKAEGAHWYDDSDAAHVVMARAVFAMKEVMTFETAWMRPTTQADAVSALEALNELSASSSVAHLTGPEEAARLMKDQPSAIAKRPAELFDRADFDEALNGKLRDDGNDPMPDKPEVGGSSSATSPAPARRRKVKA